MPSVFTRIMNGELPGHVPYSDDRCIALMSINPIAPGHCLVIPRAEIDQWTALDDDLASHLTTVAGRLGRALADEFPCERIGLVIAGFEVPHCHLHVIPARNMADLDFSRAAASVDQQVLASQSAAITARLTP
jgi:diadenosine tetraphosphate (Ap4A) HIT family hydrolase